MMLNSSTRKHKTLKREATFAIALLVLLATSSLMMTLPVAKAATTLTLSAHFNQYIGINSQTKIVWTVLPNFLDEDPNYANKTSALPDAKLTFTRPRRNNGHCKRTHNS